MTRIERNKKYAKMLLKLFGPRGAHWTTEYWGIRKRRGSAERIVYKEAKGVRRHANAWCLAGGCIKLGIKDGWLSKEVFKHTRFSNIPEFNDADGFPPVRGLLKQIAKTGSAEGAKLPSDYSNA